MPGLKLKFDAPLAPQKVQALRDALGSWLPSQGFPGDTSGRVVTVVDELFCNTMEYSGAHWTEIRADTHGTDITVAFRDDGVVFDPFEAAQKDYALYLNSDTDRRLGLYLVSRIAKDVRYRRDQGVNEVHFIVPSVAPDPMKRMGRKRA